MAKQSRRDFLKWSAAAGGAVTLAGAVPIAAAEPEGVAGSGPNGPSNSLIIARGKAAPTTEADIAAMAVKLTTEAVAALGGMSRFMKEGDSVWIKPNMAWDRTPELAANTNPAVVATLVKLCLEAGASKVRVGDFPCNEAKQTYVSSGIADAAKKAGAEVVFIDENRFREMDLGGQVLKNWPVYPDIVEADLIINCPIVKHHSISTVTACMKNYMGVANNRSKWHQNLPVCLADIAKFLQPKARLQVVDAIRVLTANGPTGGDPKDVKRLDTLAAGTDIVACDAFAAELLGHKPEDIPTVVAGHKAGLGVIDYRSIAKEIEVA